MMNGIRLLQKNQEPCIYITVIVNDKDRSKPLETFKSI
jgi:hypothetical protein